MSVIVDFFYQGSIQSGGRNAEEKRRNVLRIICGIDRRLVFKRRKRRGSFG